MRLRLLCIATTWCVASVTYAQLPQTRLGTLFPPGGQAGTTFEVRIGGEQDLEYDAAPQLLFDHPGITAEAVVDAGGNWQGNAFRVTAAADVPPGRYDARVAGYYGASNPRTLRIEARPSAVETTDSSAAAPASLVTDQAIYGRIESAADVDVFTFAGEAGRTVIVRCSAASLDSTLQPVLELAAPSRRRIGFAGGAFRGDAMLPIVLPETGEYRVKLTDASYRGGPDFAYRLEVATRPVIASVFPPAGVPGQSTLFVLSGYNLPGGEPVAGSEPLLRKTIEIALPAEHARHLRSALLHPSQTVVEGFDYIFSEGNTAADAIPIYFSPQPLIAEAEPNDEPVAAQKIVVPAEIAGRFEAQNDVDRYVFDAKQGEVFFVEAFARRYESAADPVIAIDQLSGPDGAPAEKTIATADDTAENLAPNAFDTVSDDPLIRFEAPSDGTYRVSIRDRYFASRGDPLLQYRLSIRKPSPDFHLAVVPLYREKADVPPGPGGLQLRKGESVAVGVYAFRRDGFNGPIAVTAEDLAASVTTRGVTIAEGQTSASLVVSAAADAAAAHVPIRVIGEATIDANGTPQLLRREARVGTLTRGGAGQTVHARLAGNLTLSVLEESVPFRLSSEGGVVRVGQGSQILVPLSLERQAGYAEPVTVAAEGLPADAKVTPHVQPFAPEVPSQLARFVVDSTAPPRTYAVALKGTAKIDVAKFPLRLKKAQAAQAVAAQAFAQSDESLKQVTALRDQAAQTVQASEAFAQSTAAPLAAQAVAAVEAAKASLAAFEATLATADATRKQAEAAKQAADKAATDAQTAAAVQKIDYVSPAPNIAFTIVPAAATFAIEAPNGGQLKRGETIDIKVTATRQNGFAGPIELELALPPNISGVTAEAATIPADATEATLKVTAAADAAEGDFAFPAIRTTAEHNGQVIVDVPVAFKVIP